MLYLNLISIHLIWSLFKNLFNFILNDVDSLFHLVVEERVVTAFHHQARGSRWRSSGAQSSHIFIGKWPREDINILGEMLGRFGFGGQWDTLLIDPSEGYLNSSNIVSSSDFGDKRACNEFWRSWSSKWGISFSLNPFFFAVRDKTLRIVTHTNMELELVDSWHHNIASFIFRNKAINALLAEVGDSNSSSFILFV